MLGTFNFFGEAEIPSIVLSNPNGGDLHSLGLAYNTKIVKRFNAMSEFSFEFPKSIDGGITTIPAYSMLVNKRIVKVDGFGWFQIYNVQEDDEGVVPIKSVSCYSLESELSFKRISLYGGTKKLYDFLSPENTILNDMVSRYAPSWSIGSIDIELTTKFRTFDVSDTNVYNFLMEQVAKAFNCIFIFDTTTRTINAKTSENAVTETDIFLSFDNLIEKASFSEKSDEIVTCLAVYGGGGLDIRAVNPLGTDRIYDFSYYTNNNWMSDELISAVTQWQNLVDSKQDEYSDILVVYKERLQELLDLQNELDELNTELEVLLLSKKALVENGSNLNSINLQIADKEAQIASKEMEISAKEVQLETQYELLQDIVEVLSFDNNFTEDEYLELSNFIFENTYKNENIIQSDLMDNIEIQEAQEELYEQAKTVLEKVSQPRYEISLESINYLYIKDFELFSQDTDVGKVFTIELGDGRIVETFLLEISFTFDKPDDFSLTFSNNLRLDNENFKYGDILTQLSKIGSTVSFDSAKWANWANNYKDEVTGFITSSLDATKNNLINNTNQEITISQNGLIGKKFIPETSSYSGEQVWLTSNVLAFSNDGFNTAKLAIGKVTLGSNTYYGIIDNKIETKVIRLKNHDMR